MSYVVLARKWRPKTFADLIGQEHVTRTLANAITSGRVAHAYLFTGVRGVGKTTAARILAKALNCSGKAGQAAQASAAPSLEAPSTESPSMGAHAPSAKATATMIDPGVSVGTVEPCQHCPACREIAAGTDVDVREIDGASYTGIDDVRRLQDSLPYRPSRDRYKIFIIDEVHMLSQSAWNAFLKTLEEPPDHVKFIFATTEVHKVPVTILSRVQRFDFKLIPTPLIAARLRYVLDREGVTSDDPAISILAREAAGSMRDAMSLLDQVIAWSNEGLTGEGVARVLGVASRQVLHDLARALTSGDAARCVGIVSALASQGYDVATVARDILALLRDLVVAKVCEDPSHLLDVADEEARDILQLAAATDVDDLLRLHQGFSQGFDGVIRSGQPRAALEMLLVRLARRPPLVPIDDLVQRLAMLERRLRGTPPSGPRAAPGGGGAPSGGAGPQPTRRGDAGAGSAVRGRPDPARAEGETVAPSHDSETAPHPARAGASMAADSVGGGLSADSVHAVPSPSSPPERPSRLEPPERARPGSLPPAAAPAPPRRTPSTRPEARGAMQERSSEPSVTMAHPELGAGAQQGSSSEPPPSTGEGVTLSARWRALLETIRVDAPRIAAVLQHAAALEVSSERIHLAFEPGSVFASAAADVETHDALRAAARVSLEAEPRVLITETGDAGIETVARWESREREARLRTARQRARAHPAISLAGEILGARLREIRLPDE